MWAGILPLAFGEGAARQPRHNSRSKGEIKIPEIKTIPGYKIHN
jgi:hypothetical protein